MTLLEPPDIDRMLFDLPVWRRDGDALRATFSAPDFPAAIALVQAVAGHAERMDHHPDIDIRYTDVTFVLSTHSEGGITAKDVELARAISTTADLQRVAPSVE